MENNETKDLSDKALNSLNVILTRALQSMLDSCIAEFSRTLPNTLNFFYKKGYADGVDSATKEMGKNEDHSS